MKQHIYEGLKSALKVDTKFDDEVIGLTGNFSNYFLNIYGEKKDNYELIIEEICYCYNSKVTNQELTNEQVDDLNRFFQEEVKKRLVLIESYNNNEWLQ